MGIRLVPLTVGVVLAATILAAARGLPQEALVSRQPLKASFPQSAQEDTEPQARAEDLFREGQRLVKAEQYEKAIPLLQQALDIFHRRNQKDNVMFCLRALVETRALAADIYQQYAEELVRLDRDPTLHVSRLLLARDQMELGRAYFAQHRYAAAIRDTKIGLQSLAGSRDVDALRQRAAGERGLATIYGVIGEQAAADLHWQQMAQFSRQAGDWLQLAVALANLCDVNMDYGDIGQAEKQATWILKLVARRPTSTTQHERIDVRHAEMSADTALAEIAHLYGNFVAARRSYVRAEKAAYGGLVSQCETGLAELDSEEGNDRQAEARYRSLLRTASLHSDTEESTVVRLEYARYLIRRRRYRSAIPLLTEGELILKKAGWGAHRGDCWLLTGECSVGLHQWKSALDQFDRVLQLGADYSATDDLWRAHLGRGRSLEGLGCLREALTEYETAITTQEWLYRRIAPTAATPEAPVLRHVAPYQATFRLLWQRHARQDAFDVNERARTQLLRQTLSASKIEITRGMSKDQIRVERQLRQEYTASRDRFNDLQQQQGVSPEALGEARRQRELAASALDAFEIRLRPELKARRGDGRAATWADLIPLARQTGLALLDYVVTDREVYLFAVDSHGVTPIALSVSPEALGQRIDLLNRHLTDWRNGQPAPQEAEWLYTKLIVPAAARLTGARTVCIIPDGALWQLPFAALVDGQREGPRYLIERFALQVAPSVTALKAFAQRAVSASRRSFPKSCQLAVLCNPNAGRHAGELAALRGNAGVLRYALQEASKIRSLYPHGSVLYAKQEATPSRAVAALMRYRIVHFAAHGFYVRDHPMHSYLLLSADKAKTLDRDDYLEARDLVNTDIRTHLLVFSACETARGHVVPGEGLIGMTWAAFAGGAVSQVAALWKIDDRSTVTLMHEFYLHLHNGQTIAQAMRQAQLALLHRTEYSHPFFWAPFLVLGSGERP